MSAVIDQSTEQAQPVQQPEQKPVQVVGPQPKGRKPFLWGMADKPWFVVTALIAGGLVWLANNTWVITNNLDKPYMLLTIPVAVLSILAGWMTYKFFQSILSGCKSAWAAIVKARKEDGSAQFFWLVIIVFMIVSVFTSGSFFSLLEHNVLPGLGYATALFIDLVAVQSMRARLNAVRMRDMKGANLYLFGVLICSGASAFANVYISLAHFQATVTGVLPLWMLHVAPWFGLVFPALILLLSITADYTLDQISTKLNPDQYKEQEEKRMKLLEIQRDMLRRRSEIEREIDAISARKERRVFFLVNWLFPVRQPNVVQAIETAIGDLRNVYDPYMQQLTNQNLYLRTQLEGISQQLTSLEEQQETDSSLFSDDIQRLQNQLDQMPKMEAKKETPLSSDERWEMFKSVDIPVDELDAHPFSIEDDMGDDDLVALPDDKVVDTEERESVNSQMTNLETPRPRITVKLDDIHGKQERNTDKLKPVNRGAVNRSSSADNEVLKSARRILKRTPDIRPIDLAKKLKISRQYAGTLKAKIVAEQSA